MRPLAAKKNQVCGVVEHSGNPFTVYMVCISHGRGRIHAARGRLPCGNVFGFVYAVPGVCRGGNYASRQGCATRGVCGQYGRFPRFVGRAFTPAANVRRGQDPALQCETNNMRPLKQATPHGFTGRIHAAPTIRGTCHANRKRSNYHNVSRAACMPPLRIDQTPSQPKNGTVSGRSPVRVRGTLICRGGIYASRQGCAPRGVPGSLPVSLVCRAGVHARRTDHFLNFKNNNVRRGQDPALQGKANTMPTQQRVATANTSRTVSTTGNVARPVCRPYA